MEIESACVRERDGVCVREREREGEERRAVSIKDEGPAVSLIPLILHTCIKYY